MELAAKMMADALAKASAELEKTIKLLTEQLSAINQTMEASLQEELSAVRERLEQALRQNQDALLRDKESVIKTLAEFKQAEIEKIVLSGKSVRSGLSAQLEDASRGLASSVQEKLVGIKDKLASPEQELKKKFEEIQRELHGANVKSHERLVKIKASHEESISKNGIEFDSKLNSKIGEGQSVLQARFERNRKDLERSGDRVLEALAEKYDEVTARMEGASHDGLVEVRKTGQDAIIRLTQAADTSTFVQEQDKNFVNTLDNLGSLLNGLYETRLNNLLAQSRTEITSASRHAEECLAVTKTELQTELNAFQRDYKARYEALFAKLEKTIEDYSKKKENGALRGLKEERAKDHLNTLFRRIGQEMVDSAALTARNLEAEFQRSMDEFEKRIENAKAQASESLERESRLMQKEMTRNLQDFEKQITDLKAQTAVLERKGKEAAHLVMTLKQADLDL